MLAIDYRRKNGPKNPPPLRNLAACRCRWIYFAASPLFLVACASEATRQCNSLAEAASAYPRLIADAYLMGGEL